MTYKKYTEEFKREVLAMASSGRCPGNTKCRAERATWPWLVAVPCDEATNFA